MIKRRGLLLGILSAGMAPAIVHNPMKIFVRKPDIFADIYMSNLCKEIVDPWGVSTRDMNEFIKSQIALREQAKANMFLDDSAHNQRVISEGFDKLQATSDRRRMQVMDTSRGFQLYEIPLHPVNAKTYKPVRVPEGIRIHRFS